MTCLMSLWTVVTQAGDQVKISSNFHDTAWLALIRIILIYEGLSTLAYIDTHVYQLIIVEKMGTEF